MKCQQFGSNKSSPSSSKVTSAQFDGNVDEVTKSELAAPVRGSGVVGPPPSLASPQPVSSPPSGIASPRISRSPSRNSSSPLGSRAASPGSFGYPYSQPMSNGLFTELAAPTAIHG